MLNKKEILKRPSWEEWFMSQAYHYAERTSCLNFAVGAVIVDEKTNHVLAGGYNGYPRGIESCFERLYKGMGEKACRKVEAGIPYHVKNSGKCQAIHAEINAMNHLSYEEAKGKSIYVTIFPCISCAYSIVNKGISKVVYSEEYVSVEREEAEKILKEGNVEIIKLFLSPERRREISERVNLINNLRRK
ncbi:MAG: deaminase [Candidatus Pacearchaeota archaeon]